MTTTLSALHIASEVAPFVKTGGLADVVRALPGALARAGMRVTLVVPRYRLVDPGRHGLARRLAPLTVRIGEREEQIHIHEGTLPGGQVAVYLVDHPLFDREGLYGENGVDYPDNALRFGLLGAAALTIADHTNRWPDLVHAHDWQGALALAYARRPPPGRAAPRTVLTIHNLALLGFTDLGDAAALGLPRELAEQAELAGKLSLLKLGIACADRITTVSPRYAAEIQTVAHGAGLEGFLAARKDRLVGILNGIDTAEWNPAHDGHLAATYDANDLTGKATCKQALQRELGLPIRPNLPLIGSVSRLTEQKGYTLLVEAGEELARLEAQWVFLGSGERRYEEALAALARRHPTRFVHRAGRDDGLAHRITAGADMFLMPSRFEPCGLSQMHSQRYGTAPIVRAVGGLDDTVVDWDDRTRTGTGFKFVEFTPAALLGTLKRALAAHRDRAGWNILMRQMMGVDHGWSRRAARYVDVYRALVP